jgi:hypothetical protein
MNESFHIFSVHSEQGGNTVQRNITLGFCCVEVAERRHKNQRRNIHHLWCYMATLIWYIVCCQTFYEWQQFEIPSVDKGFALPCAEQRGIQYKSTKIGWRESVLRLYICYLIYVSFTLTKSRPLKLLTPSVKTDYLSLSFLKWNQLRKYLSFASNTIAYIGRNTKMC